MVEVFKTNVRDRKQAKVIIEQIHQNFPAYKANFDLDDCDMILRVETRDLSIQSILLIYLLNKFGFEAEVLPDTPLYFEHKIFDLR